MIRSYEILPSVLYYTFLFVYSIREHNEIFTYLIRVKLETPIRFVCYYKTLQKYIVVHIGIFIIIQCSKIPASVFLKFIYKVYLQPPIKTK